MVTEPPYMTLLLFEVKKMLNDTTVKENLGML